MLLLPFILRPPSLSWEINPKKTDVSPFIILIGSKTILNFIQERITPNHIFTNRYVKEPLDKLGVNFFVHKALIASAYRGTTSTCILL